MKQITTLTQVLKITTPETKQFPINGERCFTHNFVIRHGVLTGLWFEHSQLEIPFHLVYQCKADTGLSAILKNLADNRASVSELIKAVDKFFESDRHFIIEEHTINLHNKCELTNKFVNII